MTQPLFALSLGFGGVILATQIAFGAPQCDSRDRVTALLVERYGESRQALGLAGQAGVMELYASEATGTWTITLTLPDGRMCLMASGSAYNGVADKLPARGERV